MLKTLRSLLTAGRVSLGILLASLLGVGFAVSQGQIVIVQAGLPSAPSLYSTASTTSGLYFTASGAGFSKHVLAGSTATANLPVLSACGTSSALATGSTDFAGNITVCTTASNGCTLTFGTTYTTAPFCVYQNLTTGAAANVLTISATALAWSSALADSTVLIYNCVGVGS